MIAKGSWGSYFIRVGINFCFHPVKFTIRALSVRAMSSGSCSDTGAVTSFQ